MLDLLRTRLAKGKQTSGFPAEEPTFPARFRGRPKLDCGDCDDARCPAGDAMAPSGLIRADGKGRAQLDVGACLFAPEEAVGTPGCGVTFGHDYRLSSRTREGMISATGEIPRTTPLEY